MNRLLCIVALVLLLPAPADAGLFCWRTRWFCRPCPPIVCQPSTTKPPCEDGQCPFEFEWEGPRREWEFAPKRALGVAHQQFRCPERPQPSPPVEIPPFELPDSPPEAELPVPLPTPPAGDNGVSFNLTLLLNLIAVVVGLLGGYISTRAEDEEDKEEVAQAAAVDPDDPRR